VVRHAACSPKTHAQTNTANKGKQRLLGCCNQEQQDSESLLRWRLHTIYICIYTYVCIRLPHQQSLRAATPQVRARTSSSAPASCLRAICPCFRPSSSHTHRLQKERMLVVGVTVAASRAIQEPGSRRAPWATGAEAAPLLVQILRCWCLWHGSCRNSCLAGRSWNAVNVPGTCQKFRRHRFGGAGSLL